MLPRTRSAPNRSGQLLAIPLKSVSSPTHLNAISFEAKTGLCEHRIEKCIRILKAFTETGVAVTESKEVTDEETGKKVKKSRKVINKIPSAVLRQAKGCETYTYVVNRT